MNPTLAQLAQQSGITVTAELEKFAELIVEECAQICDVVRENEGGDKQFGARLCADEIRYLNRRS
jgi:hypothetical protein